MFQKKLAFFVLLSLFSCSILKEVVKKPTVSFKNVDIKDISFSDLTAEFNFTLSNPNPVSMSINGYDYSFIISKREFLKGREDEKIHITANGKSGLSIPVTINYVELFKLVTSMSGRDSIPYTFKGNIRPAGPFEGMKIPLSTKGWLPVLKTPSFDFETLKVKNLTLSGVEFVFSVKLNNPNSFGISLTEIDYGFKVEGHSIANGLINREVSIPKKGSNILDIPISVNFLEIGSGVRDIFLKEKVAVSFKGSAKIKTRWKIVELNFEKLGSIKIK